jgi:hypothetical protein
MRCRPLYRSDSPDFRKDNLGILGIKCADFDLPSDRGKFLMRALYSIISIVPFFICSLLPAQSSQVKLRECEALTRCVGEWTIDNGKGTATWDTGGKSKLSVQRFDSSGVVIHREDITNRGFTADYTGTIHGNFILGDVVWSFAGQKTPGKWSATILGSPRPIIFAPGEEAPKDLHFCAGNCMTLALQSGGYYLVTTDNGFRMKDGSPATSIWTVERFTPELVIIDRADSMGFGAIYKGQISEDGNQIVNLSGNGSPAQGVLWTWGADLNLAPGSNAERKAEAMSPNPERVALIQKQMAAFNRTLLPDE